MNKDWIYADGENINIHHDLMPKIINKFGADGVMMIATVVARGGETTEEVLLKSSSDGIKFNQEIINKLIENKVFERVGENIKLIEGVFDNLINQQ